MVIYNDTEILTQEETRLKQDKARITPAVIAPVVPGDTADSFTINDGAKPRRLEVKGVPQRWWMLENSATATFRVHIATSV